MKIKELRQAMKILKKVACTKKQAEKRGVEENYIFFKTSEKQSNTTVLFAKKGDLVVQASIMTSKGEEEGISGRIDRQKLQKMLVGKEGEIDIKSVLEPVEVQEFTLDSKRVAETGMVDDDYSNLFLELNLSLELPVEKGDLHRKYIKFKKDFLGIFTETSTFFNDNIKLDIDSPYKVKTEHMELVPFEDGSFPKVKQVFFGKKQGKNYVRNYLKIESVKGVFFDFYIPILSLRWTDPALIVYQRTKDTFRNEENTVRGQVSFYGQTSKDPDKNDLLKMVKKHDIDFFKVEIPKQDEIIHGFQIELLKSRLTDDGGELKSFGFFKFPGMLKAGCDINDIFSIEHLFYIINFFGHTAHVTFKDVCDGAWFLAQSELPSRSKVVKTSLSRSFMERIKIK
mgnify:CR=1 FL=1